MSNLPSPLTATFYLALGRRPRRLGNPNDLVGRLTHKPPDLAAGEIAVALKVSLPRALFERPQFKADIAIDPKDVTPIVVNANVADNIAASLSAQLGINVTVQAVPTAESA